MGIIKAAINAVGGGLADSWLEVIEPSPMGDNTLICPGQLVSQNGKSQNKKGSENIVSNGSVIHVYDNQMMILIDGGKIVDFTAEPGYFKVNNSSMPSLFCGQFGDSIKETFNRIKYGGIPSQAQRVFYINLQEIKGIPFGTSTPVNYFDNFYNSELMLRAHGTYSIKVVEPFKFYQEVIPREAVTENKSVDFADVRAQYNEEFVGALGSAINIPLTVRESALSSQNSVLSVSIWRRRLMRNGHRLVVWKSLPLVWMFPTQRTVRSSSICATRAQCSRMQQFSRAMLQPIFQKALKMPVQMQTVQWQALWAWALV